MDKIFLQEDRKSELIAKSRHADNYNPNNRHKGKNRFERRLHSRVSASTKEFNKINMEKLFTKDILDVKIIVHGETSDYSVKISFSGVIGLMREQIQRNHSENEEELTVRDIMRALSRAFDTTDVYIHCSCPDFKYRFGYWSIVNDTSSFTDHRTDDNNDIEDWKVAGMQPVVTNPIDSKGAGCKHCMLVLSNNTWLIKVASVIRNYTLYIKSHYENLYAEKIYPALFGKDYEEPYQQDMFKKELSKGVTDDSEEEDDIDVANKWSKTRGQWQKGNKYRFQPVDKQIKGQQELDLDSLVDDGEEPIPEEEN